MELAERLTVCRQCTNRQMKPENGLVCSLTSQKPTFESECPDFKKDPQVNPVVKGTDESMEQDEIFTRLSSRGMDRLRLEQNVPVGMSAGIIAGLVGALLWAAVSVTTGYQIGYMAIGVGAIVGFAIRYFGKGIDPIFGFGGAVIAVVACALGNFFSTVGFVAQENGIGYIEVLSWFDAETVAIIMQETFSLMDLFFYGLAGYEGYKFAFRQLSEEDIAELNSL